MKLVPTEYQALNDAKVRWGKRSKKRCADGGPFDGLGIVRVRYLSGYTHKHHDVLVLTASWRDYPSFEDVEAVVGDVVYVEKIECEKMAAGLFHWPILAYCENLRWFVDEVVLHRITDPLGPPTGNRKSPPM